MENEELYLKESPNLSLIDTLEMQPGTEVIFKAHGRAGVPQKILRVHQDFCLIQPGKEDIHLADGDYIAAYKTPQSSTMSRSHHLARIYESELNLIDDILKNVFDTSLKKEKAANNPISIKDLPMLPVRATTIGAIDMESKTIYESDGKSKSGLHSIVRLNKDMSFWVIKDEKYLYKAHKGDYFVVIYEKRANKQIPYLAPVSKDDEPAIKMHDKKEIIARKYEANKLLGLKTLIHHPRKKTKQQRTRV